MDIHNITAAYGFTGPGIMPGRIRGFDDMRRDQALVPGVEIDMIVPKYGTCIHIGIPRTLYVFDTNRLPQLM